MSPRLLIALASLVFAPRAFALNVEPDAVFVRVIDTGPGLACVIRMPGDHYMVYDTGHWTADTHVLGEVQAIIPNTESIDLLVLSHTDSDHLGATDEILSHYTVDRILRPGLQRQTQTWRDANTAIAAEVSATVINLRNDEFPDGATYRFGETFVTKVFGRHWPPNAWRQGLSLAERRNAGSIVIRLQFRNRAILFTGDAVGRHTGDPIGTLIASERIMVESSSVIRIDSEVLIAPHHGGDNASSTAFIHAVDPTFVIFSAGHAHRHPRGTTAQRYLGHGVPVANIFRTDRGDDEGPDEWDHGRVANESDPRGDDDVDILLRPTGEVLVEYRHP